MGRSVDSFAKGLSVPYGRITTVPGLISLYFIYKCLIVAISQDGIHLTCYDSIELSENQFSLSISASQKEMQVCEIIPKFSENSWKSLKSKESVYITEICDSYKSYFDIRDNLENDLVNGTFDDFGYHHQSLPCLPVHNVTIIVPYRKRLFQLKRFLAHMHPFLQLQKLLYRIIIVEQKDELEFNRAKLFNVGFVESMKRFPSHCYIFHDVDILPENLYNIYGCTKSPRHMSTAINSWRYQLPYEQIFGGVVSMTYAQFQEVNGSSNEYFGWGGEDDDMYQRLMNRGLEVVRFNRLISSYRMLPHVKDPSGNKSSVLLSKASERFELDGLSNLKYTLITIEDGPLFTYVQVRF